MAHQNQSLVMMMMTRITVRLSLSFVGELMQSQTQILMRKPPILPIKKKEKKETPEANQMTLRGGKKLPEPQLPASKRKGKKKE
ncbi:hypothetical protein ACP275_13G051900 [Erythranthe tilingii]